MHPMPLPGDPERSEAPRDSASVTGPRRRGSARVLSAAVLCATLLGEVSARAGLKWTPAPSPEGADVASLAADGATLWAASSRGVHRLSAGLWTLDGLGDRSVLSVTVADGFVWAATGDALFRRLADGTWVPETLPGVSPFPNVLLADGSTLYVGGVGVIRRAGGAFTALPSPGTGIVTALASNGAFVLAGTNTGVVAQWNGSSWSPAGGVVGAGEDVQVLAAIDGVLYAGTNRGLYSLSGATWIADANFGARDVRAVAKAAGAIHVATADAGVFRRNGSIWTSLNAGLVTTAVRALALSGGDLLAGTRGGPVQKLSGSTWVAAGTGLFASTITDLAFTTGSLPVCGGDQGGLVVATLGAGIGFVPGPSAAACPGAPAYAVPQGCGATTAVAFAPFTSTFDVLAATACGPFGARSGGGDLLTAGLPSGTTIQVLGQTPSGLVGGTNGSGLYRFGGSAWSPDNAGIASSVTARSIRTVGNVTYAGLDVGLHQRTGVGSWALSATGLPPGASVQALGGGATAFAALSGGGVYRRDAPSAPWRADGAGLLASPVSSLESMEPAKRLLAAAAGPSGVFVKRKGGWAPESSGLPAGADARVVRAWQYAGDVPQDQQQRLFLGTAGHGLFWADTKSSVRTIPVVLDVVGGTGARYRTELTLGSRASLPVVVSVTFRPAPGFGAPTIPPSTVSLTLFPGAEARAADALDFLRSRGATIPAGGSQPIAGSLSVSAVVTNSIRRATDDVYAIARTYTAAPGGGSFGLFYDGVSSLDAAEERGTVFGLRSVSGAARSHLALVHLPTGGSQPITLSVQVYAAAGTPAPTALSATLQPGEWRQFNDVLLAAGLSDGAFGYARITRTAGSGSWAGYGVVNDAKTSDGSFLPLVRPGGAAAARRLVVPVVLDVFGSAGSHFTTELTLANDGPVATPVDLVYRPAPGFGTAPGAPVVTLNLGAREQRTIPDVLQHLRQNGVNVPDAATGGPQAGTLTAEFRFLSNLDAGETVALARTSTPNPDAVVGGSFGLFYGAVPRGGGARTAAVVPSLTQNGSVRSNLAVVHLGGGSELPLVLSVRLYRAADGGLVGSPLTVTLQPGEWFQWGNVLEQAGAAPGVTDAVAVVSRVSGDDTFLAYGVSNDAATSDGSFLEMIASDD